MGVALKHLAEERRIEIARGLFRVTSEDESRGELIGLYPIHEDRNPSFAYNFARTCSTVRPAVWPGTLPSCGPRSRGMRRGAKTGIGDSADN